MANTLTNLIPDAYVALDIVSRELTGFIPSVLRNSTADRTGINQTLRIPITPTATVGDITPAMSIPSIADQTITNATLTISKQREAKFSWSGAEQVAVSNGGVGYQNLRTGQLAQAIRALANEVETDIATAGLANASRAFGTAATTPFGTANDYTAASNLHKILADNGAPLSDKQLVISTATGVNLRGKQATSQNSLDDSLLRQGVLQDINGFMIRESAGLGAAFTKGTGANYVINGANAAGATTVAVKTGTGTILAGDVVTINGENYVVRTALAGGNIVINAPGLRTAAADGDTVTLIGNRNQAGVAFDRGAILLATRVPDAPAEGDLAILSELITDPRTGLVFDVRVYPGNRMITVSVGLAWGVSVIKPAHSALLIG
jgi:hypothetical protein